MEHIGGSISIREIFLCNQAWLRFWTLNALLLRWAILWNVAKMLLCRKGWGHSEYQCPNCNTSRQVPHTCKSRFCSSCGKAAVDRWVETTLSDILDVQYQHLVFTIPEGLRDWFRMNRKLMLNALFRAVKNTLLEWTQQRGYRPGLILVLHTFGAEINWNPHIHVIITCGGLSINETKWIVNRYLPWNCIRPMYRYAFLHEFKTLFNQGEIKPPPSLRFIRTPKAFNSYLSQFHKKEWYVHLGETLAEANFTVRYVGRYGKRPVIAESKIISFNGDTVTFQYKDRATKEQTLLTLSVMEFIGRLVQHIPDMYFRTLRYSGIFATCIRKKKIEKARSILKQNTDPKVPRTSWRQMIITTFGYDPLVCPHCGALMLLSHSHFVNSSDIRSRVQNRQQELAQIVHPQKNKKPNPATSPRASP